MILVIGVLLTNTTITGMLTFLQAAPIQLAGNLLYQCIMAIINNLGLIFAVGIGAALAKEWKSIRRLWLVCFAYIMFLTANNVTLSTNGLLAEPSAMLGLYGTGQSTVLGNAGYRYGCIQRYHSWLSDWLCI